MLGKALNSTSIGKWHAQLKLSMHAEDKHCLHILNINLHKLVNKEWGSGFAPLMNWITVV